ncbi:MAG TPA: nitroreductase [Syntrophomonadaceae bacterium]|nr:nitroreductase [Syntrophomonadaceae bacterium]
MKMNVIDALNARFTCRAFKPDLIPKETMLKIMQAASRAPSWGNTQPWDIYVAAGDILEGIRTEFLSNMANKTPPNTDLALPLPQDWPANLKERYDSLGKARYNILSQEIDQTSLLHVIQECNYRFFDAPAVVYLCMDRSLTTYSMFDLGAVSQSIMLAAQEFGIDSAPAVMLVLYADVIRAAMAIPGKQAIVLGIALGYADRDSIHNHYRSERQPLEEIVKLYGF